MLGRENKMTMTKARYSILNRILSCPMLGQFKWKEKYDTEVQVGDLVSISSAPASEYYLSWVVEIESGDKTTLPRYVLKSIETGNLCGWANVGVNIYDREEVAQYPEWRWTDKQWAFKNRWNKVCYGWNDAYMVLPLPPVFHDDGSVDLGVRVRMSFNKYTSKKTFPNWKKCTMKMMDEYFEKCVIEEDNYKEEHGSDGL